MKIPVIEQRGCFYMPVFGQIKNAIYMKIPVIELRSCFYMPVFGQIKNAIYMKIPVIEGVVFICPFSAK